ncbi:MAG: hypothetical protein V4474_00670 [Patescibacteria group bacterium]
MAKEKTKRASKTPTTELPSLWQEGFFKEWRSAGEVAAEFAKTGCHFSASAVSKALVRSSFITRKGKGVGLRYIQTYPFEK